MKLCLFALLFVSACAYSPVANLPEDKVSEEKPVFKASPAAKEDDYAPSRPLDPDACVPERFAANSIPSDFKLDPSCPPMIYDPPRVVIINNPGDPAPIND